MNQLVLSRPVMSIRRSSRGFGFTLRSVKSTSGGEGTTTTTIFDHLVIQIDEKGLAFKAGLRLSDLILKVNDKLVSGKMHQEIMGLIMSSKYNVLNLRTVPLNETNTQTTEC